MRPWSLVFVGPQVKKWYMGWVGVGASVLALDYIV